MAFPTTESTNPTTIIVTKLEIPASPPPVIRRLRLHQMLEASDRRRVTLVVAPAGFGKTVLVSDWLTTYPDRLAAWISLDQTDNEPVRFWSYVSAALGRVGIQPTGEASWAEPKGNEHPEVTLAPLLNALADAPSDVTLVLDDYHLITNARIHREVTFLIDRQPAHLRLVVLCRAEPPLGLARLSVNGYVRRISARSLAFTEAESLEFLDQQGVVLDDDVKKGLLAVVHGWAAALRLLSFWVEGQDDQRVAIAGFVGGDVTVTDYLTIEILDQLPHEVRTFLLQTSILPRLSGALCDAVTLGNDGAKTLANLFSQGLFVQAMDSHHEWFRYQSLFAELLRHQLTLAWGDDVVELHRRASAWLAEHGETEEAIDQAILAQDWESVRQLMLGETLAIGARYEPTSVYHWLTQLPPHVVAGSPFFRLMESFVLGQLGRLDEAQHALRLARDLLKRPGPDGALPELGPLLTVVEVALARLDCDLETALRCAAEVADALSDESKELSPVAQLVRASTQISLAATLFWAGAVNEAEALITQTQREIDRTVLARMYVSCLSLRALMLASRGCLREAETVAVGVLDLAREIGMAGLFQTNSAILATAIVAVHRGDDVEAARLLEVVQQRAERHGERGVCLAAGMLAAQLATKHGDHELASDLLARQQDIWPRWEPPVTLQVGVLAERLRSCLAYADRPGAERVLSQILAVPDPSVSLAQSMATASVLNATPGMGGAAAARFAEVADAARRDEQWLCAVEAHVGAATAFLGLGSDKAASEQMLEAVSVAAPENIVSPFVAVATQTRVLLLHLEMTGGDPTHRDFRRRLLDRLGVPEDHPGRHERKSADPDELTDRELGVLRLLRGSLTSKEIAEALHISSNTLKSHTRHIYRKLGVNDRAGAIARSRHLFESGRRPRA